MSFVAEMMLVEVEVEVEVEVMLAVNIFPWITFIGLSTTYLGSESESTQWLIYGQEQINKVSGYLLVQKHCSVSVGAEFRSALEADWIAPALPQRTDR